MMRPVCWYRSDSSTLAMRTRACRTRQTPIEDAPLPPDTTAALQGASLRKLLVTATPHANHSSVTCGPSGFFCIPWSPEFQCHFGRRRCRWAVSSRCTSLMSSARQSLSFRCCLFCVVAWRLILRSGRRWTISLNCSVPGADHRLWRDGTSTLHTNGVVRRHGWVGWSRD